MKKLLILNLCIFMSIFIVFSCQRITYDKQETTLGEGKIPDLKGIPLEYGSLISVTAPSHNLALLWFVTDDGTIRRVGIQLRNNNLIETVRVIPRY